MGKKDLPEPSPSSTIRPAGREIEVWNDELFQRLRKENGVPDDFLNEGWTYDKLEKGGGKGGTLMAFLWGKYIVKEMNKGDHEAMLKVTPSYIEHMCGGDSRICPVFLHYRDIESGRTFFAMRNEVGGGPFKSLYDLKGCADDKILEYNGKTIEAIHKRCWNFGMWCGKCRWSHERHAYYNGKKEALRLKIPMSDDQREQIVKAIAYDCEWLASENLMDYSLLLATKADAPANGADRSFRIVNDNGEESFLCISVIDFLQKWTCGKKVARCLKFTECNKATVPPKMYGKRFQRHFEKCFTVRETTIGKPEDDAADRM